MKMEGILVVFLSIILVNVIVPIPPKLDGFPYKNRVAKSGSVVIEAFYDPVCPDSCDAWPPLKQALEHYGSGVSLTVHPFSLPYHDNAFVTSQALHIVNGFNKSATYDMLEAFFLHQEEFYNANTKSKSRVEIIDELVQFVSDVVGQQNSPFVESGFGDSKTDLLTRVCFKYACSRGVAETPFFFINGFQLASNDLIDYKGSKSILDPLFSKQNADTQHQYF